MKLLKIVQWRLSILLTVLALVPLHSFSSIAEENEEEFYLYCKSAFFNLTFSLNTSNKTVKNINYNQLMDVGYWGEEAINTTFNMSLNQLVGNAQHTERVGANFNRLSGKVSILGTNPPLEERVNECREGGNWGCEDWLVVETYEGDCETVAPKF